LGVQFGEFRVVSTALEFFRQYVLDLVGNVIQDAREVSAGGPQVN
jgi:hypothetical protein